MSKEMKILFQIDTNAHEVAEEMKEYKNAVKDLKGDLKDLRKENKENTEEYKKLKEELKEQKKGFKESKDQLTGLLDENRKSIKLNEDLNKTLKGTNDSYRDFEKQNEKLIGIRSKLNTSDANYVTNLQRINSQLEENSAMMGKIAEGKAPITTMAEFTGQINEAFQSINIFNGGITGFVTRSQEAGGAGKLFSSAIGGMKDGIVGMGKAIMANPLGMLLSLLSPIIQKMMEMEPVTNAVERAMAALTPILTLVTKPLEIMANATAGVIDWFTDLVVANNDAAKAADELAKKQDALADSENKLNAQKVLSERTNEKARQQIADFIKASEDETKSINKRSHAIDNARETELKNLKVQETTADKTMQLAAQKISLIRQLSAEEQQILLTGTAAQLAALAKEKGITEEELRMLEKAKLEKIRIEGDVVNAKERYAAAHRKLDSDIVKSASDTTNKVIERSKERLELFKAEYDAHTHTNAERLKFEEVYATRAKAILKSELDAKKISHERYSTEVLRIEKQLHDNKAEINRQQADYAISLQKAVLDNYTLTEGEKAKTLAEELVMINKVAAEKKKILEQEFEGRNDALSIQQRKLANDQIELEQQEAIKNASIENANAKIALMKTELDTANENKTVTAESIAAHRKGLEDIHKAELAALEQKNGLNTSEIEDKRKKNIELTTEEVNHLNGVQQLRRDHANEEKALKDQENSVAIEAIKQKSALDQENADNEFEQQRIVNQERYDITHQDLKQQLEQGKITKEQFEKLDTEAKKEKAETDKKIDRAVLENKLNLTSQALGNVSKLLGENSTAGKAAAIAQTTIDTYMAAQKAYLSQLVPGDPTGPVRGAISAAMAVASGLANVKKITSTKTPKAEKGALFSIGGKRHSAGGTLFTGEDGTRFEAEAGEVIGVMNRNAARHFMAFNNAFPAGGSSMPNYFASGGIVSREVAQQGINTDELAAKIAQANAAIPAPVVAIEDIITRGDSYIRIKDSANF